MKAFLDQLQQQPCMAQVARTLPLIVATPAIHARMLNSLARMEYVGVRKMLKARQAEHLDLDGLEHVLEEASHALRLKRAAIKLNGGSEEGVRTFAASDTLAGDEAEDYLQGVDRGCEQVLDRYLDSASAAPLDGGRRLEANYLLSSAVIEIRADTFYPLYEESLQAAGAPFSVSSIIKDELRHLAEMAARLEQLFPQDWRALVAEALQQEQACFDCWASSMARAAEVASAACRVSS